MEKNIEKIEIFSTYNISRDNGKFERIKNKLEDFLKANKIEYVIELIENKNAGGIKTPKTLYSFWLIVQKRNAKKVKEYFEKIKVQILNEYEKEIGVDEVGEIQDNVKETKSKLIAKVFVILIWGIIIVFELAIMINSIISEVYTNIAPIIIIILIEMPFINKTWKFVKNRREY